MLDMRATNRPSSYYCRVAPPPSSPLALGSSHHHPFSLEDFLALDIWRQPGAQAVPSPLVDHVAPGRSMLS